MKKRIWLSGFLILAGFLIVGGACAADDSSTAPSTASTQAAGGGASADMNQKVKQFLGLTDAQETQIREIFRQQNEQTQILQDQLKLDRDVLVQKLNDNAPESEIQKALDAVIKDQRTMDESRQKTEDRLRAVMSPSQMAKFLLLPTPRPMAPPRSHP